MRKLQSLEIDSDMNENNRQIVIENENPITVEELLKILQEMKENGMEDYQIEVGLESLFLHKISYIVNNKVVSFV